jgi:hypothetical protein
LKKTVEGFLTEEAGLKVWFGTATCVVGYLGWGFETRNSNSIDEWGAGAKS